jgi:hypothetical protein
MCVPVRDLIGGEVEVLGPFHRVRAKIKRHNARSHILGQIQVEGEFKVVLSRIVVCSVKEVRYRHDELIGAITIQVCDGGCAHDMCIYGDNVSNHVLPDIMKLIV